MPSKAEQSREEQSRAEPSIPRATPSTYYPETDDDRDGRDTYYELTGKRPWGTPAGDWVLRLADEYGAAPFDAALRAEHVADQAVRTLLGRVEARLARDRDKRETQARIDREAAAPKSRVTPEEAEANRRAIADEVRRMTGGMGA